MNNNEFINILVNKEEWGSNAELESALDLTEEELSQKICQLVSAGLLEVSVDIQSNAFQSIKFKKPSTISGNDGVTMQKETEALNTSWQEAKERFDDARWEVSTYVVTDSETICVHISRGGITSENSNIYVCTPNWIERRLKLTFDKKVLKVIRRQQKECDILNARIRRKAELDVMAEAMLTVAEMEREGKTVTLAEKEKRK